ncbi:terpene synthase family protein [Sphaerisporangium corydalis]|uniref:Terpene synthase n=1 Tax=Sphaerisporangium corydalis TaxID=1441875 RepID=A0ABV9ES13_9ACTN|nr:hypothetical protein [Sphaerisporangium corydalis]
MTAPSIRLDPIPRPTSAGGGTDPHLDEVLPRAFDDLPPMVNEHVAAARRHLDAWVARHGLVGKVSARERFARADFGWFAAVTYPTADESGLCLIADWFAWLFLLDDRFRDIAVGREPARCRELAGEIAAVLAQDGARLTARRPGGPALVESLADLWSRTAPHSTPEWRTRFSGHLADIGTAAFRPAYARTGDTIPAYARTGDTIPANDRTGDTIPAYDRTGDTVPAETGAVTPYETASTAGRQDAGAMHVRMDLIEIVERAVVPERLYDDGTYQDALRSACDVVRWTSDAYSLTSEPFLGGYSLGGYPGARGPSLGGYPGQREPSLGGRSGERAASLSGYDEPAAVVENTPGLDGGGPVSQVVTAISGGIRAYQEREIRAFAAFPAHADVLAANFAGMRSWMRGNLDWSARTRRPHRLGTPSTHRPVEHPAP